MGDRRLLSEVRQALSDARARMGALALVEVACDRETWDWLRDRLGPDADDVRWDERPPPCDAMRAMIEGDRDG